MGKVTEWEDYVKAIAPPRDSYAALTLSKRVSDGKVIRDVISETKTIYLFPHAIAFDLRRVYLLFDLTYVHLFTHEVFMDTGVNEIEEYPKKVSAKNSYVI